MRAEHQKLLALIQTALFLKKMRESTILHSLYKDANITILISVPSGL